MDGIVAADVDTSEGVADRTTPASSSFASIGALAESWPFAAKLGSISNKLLFSTHLVTALSAVPMTRNMQKERGNR